VLFSLDCLDDYTVLGEAILASQSNLVLLTGPLGVGKTTLTQYIAKALGSQASVSSPTYTLIHEYPTPKGLLIHIDAYRLPSLEALFELGLEDYLERAKLVVIEWGEALLEHFPEALLVTLSFTQESRVALIRH
jgi:tRNA threonylcarbamoyladenosine biosynthesis protein TsaE